MGLKVRLWTLDHSVSLCGLCSVCWLRGEGFVLALPESEQPREHPWVHFCSCANSACGESGCWLKHSRLWLVDPATTPFGRLAHFIFLLWFHSSPLYLFSGLKHGSNIQINLSREMTQIGFTFWTRYSIYQVSLMWANTVLFLCLLSQ